jgi:hypothetical protein
MVTCSNFGKDGKPEPIVGTFSQDRTKPIVGSQAMERR